MKKFIAEFKKFALRGNVLDLAVGVIIGGAFTGIVTALTDNFINPLLSLLFTGTPGLLADGTPWTFGGCVTAFGTTLVNFIITALVLFLLMRGINALMAMGRKKKEEAPAVPTTKVCPYCLSEIPLAATRCAHCTSQLDKE